MKASSTNGLIPKRIEILLFFIAAGATLLALFMLFLAPVVRRALNREAPVDAPMTSPGVILEEGETWVGDGLALTAADFCVLRCGEHLAVTFTLQNLTENQIIVDLLAEDAFIRLDTGAELYSAGPEGSGRNELRQQSLDGGKSFEWTWLFTYQEAETGAIAPLPPEATTFTLHIQKLGTRLSNARWRGSIPR